MPESRKTRPIRSRARNLPGARAGRRSDGSAQLLEAAQITVGKFLRATREGLRLTQSQVAERSKRTPWQLSRAAVSAIERGQNFPGLEAMLALSNVLHIDPKELIERARLTAVAPVDITGLSDEQLESRASQYFWAGDFRRALSVYDAMVHKLALADTDEAEVVERLATVEVRRATTLKRTGALISAIASAERAISLSTRHPRVQAEAYVVLADLQVQRGHLPLANDAAGRAIELARRTEPRTLTWAYMVRGRVFYLERRFDEARQAFEQAQRQAETCDDRAHLTHIAGNIGSCRLAQGDLDQARVFIERAVSLAREQRQPALEASWLVELGKIDLSLGRTLDADRLAQAALAIAEPMEQWLTIFRGEWLRHRVAREVDADVDDGDRLLKLKELYRRLDEHEGVDEIVEFKRTGLRALKTNGEA